MVEREGVVALLTELRDALAMAQSVTDHPARGALAGEGYAYEYLGHDVEALLPQPDRRPTEAAVNAWLALSVQTRARVTMAALALALGKDPGPLGLGCRWRRVPPVSGETFFTGWQLDTESGPVLFVAALNGSASREHRRLAPRVASEMNAARALSCALEHVLVDGRPC